MSKKQKLKAEKEKKLEREEQKAESQANEAVMETKRKAKQAVVDDQPVIKLDMNSSNVL